MSTDARGGRRILWNAFAHMTPSHVSFGLWRHPDGRRQLDFASAEPWIELARTLERGKFDLIFFGDIAGTRHTYEDSFDATLREGLQAPGHDPWTLVGALGLRTENLGFALTSSIVGRHPFEFARKVSTLDHLTGGRIGWNVVTSATANVWENHGYDRAVAHDDRYAWAEEYIEVVYRLWEDSWEDDAVLADVESGVYADPDKVHTIDHVGERYKVRGPHLAIPSPQRTPLILQAGSSTAGRAFAARHAEATFIAAYSPEAARPVVDDIRAQAVAAGRHPDDVKVLIPLSATVAPSKEEAQRRFDELQPWRNLEGVLVHLSDIFGVDLAMIDLDTPLETLLESDATQSTAQAVIALFPDRQATLRDAIDTQIARTFVGSTEEFADEIEAWVEAGIDGFNLVPTTIFTWFEQFVDEVVPTLRERGLIQREYEKGPLRAKLFPADGPRLPDRHPGLAVRRNIVNQYATDRK
ncbi:MAG: NtaA/DmoA family FMN-dependent monooxygenase [Solirubrobacterales bacterium]